MDNFKKYINSNFVFMLTSISFLILSLFYIKIFTRHTLVINVKLLYYAMYAVVIALYIGLIFLFKYINKTKMKIEKQFLLFGIIFGIGYMLLVPMFGVPDEPNHYLRAYEISTGNLISKKHGEQVGDYLPKNITDTYNIDVFNMKYSNIIDRMNIKADKEYAFIGFANTALYSYICYLPQSIGILIGRIINLPMMYGAYLGRILNYITWLFIMYLAIKYIPYGKKVVFMIAFIPIQMQEAISLAPDCLINSLSIGLIAYVLYHMHNKRKLDTKDYLLGALITIVISLLKIVYLPLCLLVFLIPKERFNSTKDKYIKIVLLAFICVAVNLIWLKISSGFLIEFNEGVDSSLQLSGILSNPIHYIRVILHTYRVELLNYISQMMGAYLGWYCIFVSRFMVFCYLLIIMYVAFNENNVKLNKWGRLLIAFIVFSIGLLISTSLYIQWTPVNLGIIHGIQGRYFLPVLLLMLLLITRNNKKNDLFFKWDYIELIVCAVNIIAFIALFARQAV